MHDIKDKIILIRHGESLANVDLTYYLKPDAAIILSEKGVHQSLAIAQRIKLLYNQCPNVSVMSSALTRAKLTADIATHLIPNIVICSDSRLNEVNFNRELNPSTPKELNYDVRMRVKSVLDEHKGSLIIFCHGELMWHLDPKTKHVENTEIRIYDRDYFIENNLMKQNLQIIQIK